MERAVNNFFELHLTNNLLKASLLALTFYGLVACKQTDGFSASQSGLIGFNDPNSSGNKDLLAMTDEAMKTIENRLEALNSAQKDVDLKNERLLQLETSLEAQSKRLEETVLLNQQTRELMQTNDSIPEETFAQESQEVFSLKEEVKTISEEYLANIEDYKIQFDSMIKSFSELVAEFAKYQVSEKSKPLQDAVLEKLEALVKERSTIVGRIEEKEIEIQNLSLKIEDLNSATTKSLSEITALKESLVIQQQLLAKKAEQAGVLGEAIDSSNALLGLSRQDQDSTAMDLNSDTISLDLKSFIDSLKTLEQPAQLEVVNLKIVELESGKEGLKSLENSILEELKVVQGQIDNPDSQTANDNSSDRTDLIVEKSNLVSQHSDALEEIAEIESQIAELKKLSTQLQANPKNGKI